MTTHLPAPVRLVPDAGDVADLVHGYLQEVLAAETRRAYGDAWGLFTGWCQGQDLAAVPDDPREAAEHVASFVAAEAERGVAAATIAKRLAGLSWIFSRITDYDPTSAPLVRDVLKGIRRTHGTRPSRKKAMLPATLRRLIDRLPLTAEQPEERLRALRDRALLLAFFAGAFRASDIAVLRVEPGHLVIEEGGVALLLPRSKADQAGRGTIVALPRAREARYCPAAAIADWIAAADLHEGPLFRAIRRGGRVDGRPLTYAAMRKRILTLLGPQATGYGTHSFRAGWVTQAMRSQRRRGVVDHAALMVHGRWERLETMLVYERLDRLWEHHPGAGLLDVDLDDDPGTDRSIISEENANGHGDR